MKILIAEDDAFQRAALEDLLAEWRYDVVAVEDGPQAWTELQKPDAPTIALLDWQMPGLSGLDLCAKLRAQEPQRPRHLILVTASSSAEDVRRGLEAGADDYVRKPFDEVELQARIRAGVRSVSLKQELAQRIQELETAKEKIRTLEGILPVCSYCRKIKDDADRWRKMEDYISEHSEATFSHGVCPACYASVIEPQLRDLDP